MSHRKDDRLLLTDSMLVRMLEEDGWKLNYVARKGDQIMTNASLTNLRDKFSDHDERQTMQHNNKDPLYTLNQAGDYLGRSRSQISALIAQGTFRPIRMVGLNVYNERERRIPKSQLDAWIRSNSGGTVEAYQARLVAQRDAEWKAFKAEAHEATERLKARHLAAPRWQRISWNHSRREAKRLRALRRPISNRGIGDSRSRAEVRASPIRHHSHRSRRHRRLSNPQSRGRVGESCRRPRPTR